MVMAAEINVTLSVRSFQELTTLYRMKEGLWSIQMRPSYNVVVGHPIKTSDWQRYYFYVKSDESAFEEPLNDDYRVLWNSHLGRVFYLVFMLPAD